MNSMKARLLNLAIGLAQDPARLDRRLRVIARFGGYLAPTSGHRKLLDRLLWAIDHQHPSLDLIKHVAQRTQPSYVRMLVNLFVEHVWEGHRQREAFAALHGIHPPSFVVISPLAACNLRCEGCYAGAYGDREPHLTYADIVRIIEEIRGWGSRFVVISGGEPTLIWRKNFHEEKGLRDLCLQYPDMAFLMYTNGTLIDNAMAAEMAAVGNISPAISVEGFTEHTDARRGVGTFGKVTRAMATLQKHKVLFGASVTYTTKNVAVVTAEPFIEMLMDNGCLYAWYFMYIPVGRGPNLELMTTPAQRLRVARSTHKWLTTKPIFVADFWNSGYLTKGCIAAGRPGGYLHVNHRGDITPCAFIMYSTSNIHTSDSPTPLYEALASDFFTRIRDGQASTQHNPLAPCQIVDHPEVLYEAVAMTGARSTQEDQRVLTDLHPALCARAREWEILADSLWAKTDLFRSFADQYADGTWLQPASAPIAANARHPQRAGKD